ncbi:MAG: InlB B-repeat-containing protein [Spirochaetaceae bacterium]|nr:InlB B-repeat-containing protein [Spirochaetaceae bacterium]
MTNTMIFRNFLRIVPAAFCAILIFSGCDMDAGGDDGKADVLYTVTFDADGGTFDTDGGSTETQTRTAADGASIGEENMSEKPSKTGYAFDGWYTEKNGGGSPFTEATEVNADITVYAKWTNLSFVKLLAWISKNAKEGGVYTITLSSDESVSPETLSYNGKTVSITLKGDTAERTVSLASSGSLFTVGSGVTLILDGNITLQGLSNNKTSLVRVTRGGELEMKAGSKIRNNGGHSSNSPVTGGGVNVYNGTFTMNGGKISGNTASAYDNSYGGGVWLDNANIKKQSGGIIYGSNEDSMSNIAAADSGSSSGHAVYRLNYPIRKRDTTAGPGVDLDSRKNDGWE